MGVGALPFVPLTDPSDLWSAPLSKIYIQHPTLSDDELAEVAARAAGGFVTVTMAGEGIVELLPLGLSKATGLSLAARRLGLKAADTIAFGDMPNDIPMFAWAAHGVAMANAHDELRAVADEVTSSNDEDGIAVVLERLLGRPYGRATAALSCRGRGPGRLRVGPARAKCDVRALEAGRPGQLPALEAGTHGGSDYSGGPPRAALKGACANRRASGVARLRSQNRRQPPALIDTGTDPAYWTQLLCPYAESGATE